MHKLILCQSTKVCSETSEINETQQEMHVAFEILLPQPHLNFLECLKAEVPAEQLGRKCSESRCSVLVPLSNPEDANQYHEPWELMSWKSKTASLNDTVDGKKSCTT